MILYTRSSYCYNNIFIIYLFSEIFFLFYKLFWSFITDVSLILMDSDTESEHPSLLIQLSVSDGQKTDSSEDVSFIGI